MPDIEKARAAMQARVADGRPFTLSELREIGISAGGWSQDLAERWQADRLADRIIQAERRNGRIHRRKRVWYPGPAQDGDAG